MSDPNPIIVVNPVVQERTKFVDRNITIHEHRAPTDESVKLLNEMQEKALANLIASLPVKGNDFECHLAAFRDDMNRGDLFIVTAQVNGTKIEVRERIGSYEEKTIHDKFAQIRRALAEKIAAEILLEPFCKAQESFHSRR